MGFHPDPSFVAIEMHDQALAASNDIAQAQKKFWSGLHL